MDPPVVPRARLDG